MPEMINRLSEKRIISFMKWLANHGAEMLPITNEYEVIRFRCSQGVGVIYRNSKGKFSVSGPLVIEALTAFFSSGKWAGKGKPTKGFCGNKRKQQLLKRDGDECFYCGRPFELDKDITVEHLVSLSQRGPNRIENLVLAHKSCNQKADNLPVIEKVRLREKMRAEVNKK
ncbi:HNH endonuclease [Microbulbifer sp. 2304DJ12-6]|uniref:HNH endonuclease n=1 Tax=Microbulbifer sp. 2304DJ12-6 TaxID=3233340 RepID=UPI0039B0F6AF